MACSGLSSFPSVRAMAKAASPRMLRVAATTALDRLNTVRRYGRTHPRPPHLHGACDQSRGRGVALCDHHPRQLLESSRDLPVRPCRPPFRQSLAEHRLRSAVLSAVAGHLSRRDQKLQQTAFDPVLAEQFQRFACQRLGSCQVAAHGRRQPQVVERKANPERAAELLALRQALRTIRFQHCDVAPVPRNIAQSQ